MKITGIKHQWGDRLLERWGPNPDSYNVYREYDFPNYKLLTYLETIEGPDLWVGTSHSMMNFNARDAEDPSDHVPSLAWIHASRDPGWYLLEYPMPQEFCPWFNLKQGQQDYSEATVTTYTYGVESTAEMLLAAIAAAETNPGRTRADWLWYICPRCEFHLPQYRSQCERCGSHLPNQEVMQARGLYRKSHTPEGAVVPSQAEGHAAETQD